MGRKRIGDDEEVARNQHGNDRRKDEAIRRLRPNPSRGERQPGDSVCRTRSKYTASPDQSGGLRCSAAAGMAQERSNCLQITRAFQLRDQFWKTEIWLGI
jgi:hypothetical protein